MKFRNIRSSITPYLFLLPGMLLMLIWLVFPMLSALNISLRDWNIMPGRPSPFIGLANYSTAFNDPTFWLSLKNTLVYAVITVAGQLLLGLIVAILLDEIQKGKIILRTIYYLPVITSWVVVSLLFRFLFNSSSSGIINYILVDFLHFFPKPISWFLEAGTAFVAIDTLGVWKGIGFAMIIILAALQSIPAELYQAAAIDGAGYGQMLRYITLPIIVPTLLLVTVMLTIGAFQAYIPVALMTGGGPLHRTELVLSYMYGQAFDNLDFGYSSALSYILAVIVFSISQFQLRFVKTSELGR